MEDIATNRTISFMLIKNVCNTSDNTVYIRMEPDRMEEVSEEYSMYGNVNN